MRDRGFLLWGMTSYLSNILETRLVWLVFTLLAVWRAGDLVGPESGDVEFCYAQGFRIGAWWAARGAFSEAIAESESGVVLQPWGGLSISHPVAGGAALFIDGWLWSRVRAEMAPQTQMS